MAYMHARAETALDHLDRGVVIFAAGGVMFNAFAASVAGVLLTALAAAVYGLARNRVANADDFELAGALPTPPGIDLDRLTLVCAWLGNWRLLYGLLEDMADPQIGGSAETARRHLRETLLPAILTRLRERIVSLFRTERPL